MSYKKIARSVLPQHLAHFAAWSNTRFGVAFAIRSTLLAAVRGLAAVPAGGRVVCLRPGTTDQDVYDQIFREGEYANVEGNPTFIIDAGGHIGLATVFLSQRYPLATIAVVEPDAANLLLLRRNVAGLKNVHVYAGGLWSHKTRLDITNPTADSWAFRLAEGHGVEAFTVDELMRRHGTETVGLLKIDIEGAEIEVLSNSAPWMHSVQVVLIELHDRLRSGCREALERATSSISFKRSEVGEYVMLTRTT